MQPSPQFYFYVKNFEQENNFVIIIIFSKFYFQLPSDKDLTEKRGNEAVDGVVFKNTNNVADSGSSVLEIINNNNNNNEIVDDNRFEVPTDETIKLSRKEEGEKPEEVVDPESQALDLSFTNLSNSTNDMESRLR